MGLALFRFLGAQRFRYSRGFADLSQAFALSDREEMLALAMDYVAHSRLEGDYLEFGVYHGGTFVPAFHFARCRGLRQMHFYGFDSFCGLPEIQGVDGAGFRHFERGEYTHDIEAFRRVIRRRGVDQARTTLVPGWYKDVLNEGTRRRLSLEKAAVIWIDCDLYESTVPVLDFITPCVQDGTLLVFDDWFCYRGRSDRGEQRAFAEWRARQGDRFVASAFHRFGWHGLSFVLNTP